MNKSRGPFGRVFLGVLGLSIVGFGSLLAYDSYQTKKLEGPDAPSSESISTVQESSAETLPTKLNIEVPFFTQAPTGSWDFPWQEACEEASVATVANLYLDKNWTKEEFNEELLSLVDWENEHFGTYQDTTLEQTAEFMEANYGLKSVVHEDPSYEDIQDILSKGHLIIAPFAGKLLQNPNFRNGGPLYHNLVIKGYNADLEQIVTNDVGTRNGADYVYDWPLLQNALHDWDKVEITNGAKRILEVLPPTP